MIKNITKNNIISKEKKILSGFFSKSAGLMFSKNKNFVPLVFVFKKEKVVPLHMFFVFFPIDVLFLDKNKRVVEIKDNFKQFTLYNPKNNAKYVIELRQGTVKKQNIERGDKIQF